MDEPTPQSLWQLYPVLDDTHAEIASRWPGLEILNHRDECKRLVADARDRQVNPSHDAVEFWRIDLR